MNIRKSEIVIIGLVLLVFLVSICLYPKMPDRMATHWNAKGEVDGYMSKTFGVFLMPIVITVITVLFMLIPKIDL